MEVGDKERATFRQALARALEGASRTQADLGRALGVERQAVKQWIDSGDPPRHRVFEIEGELGLRPGTLSRILGYLPVTAKPAKTVDEAIAVDAALTPRDRQLLAQLYREMRQ